MPRNLSINLRQAGSGRGIHYWMDWLKCPNRRRLRDEELSRGARAISEQNESFVIGTAYHGFRELYVLHGKAGFDVDAVKIKVVNGGPTDKEIRAFEAARALFRVYRGRRGPDYFGKTLGTEVKLTVSENSRKAPDWLPRGIKVTGRLDLVVRLGKPQARQIQKDFGLFLEPGVYIVDYKTTGSAYWLRAAEIDPQLYLYQMLWNYYHPRQRTQGALIEGAVKVAPHDFPILRLPPITPAHEKLITELLANCSEAMVTRPNEKNRNFCFEGGCQCPFWGKSCTSF